jgi:hypothetical protein
MQFEADECCEEAQACKAELQALQDELAAQAATKQPSLPRSGAKVPGFNLDINQLSTHGTKNEMHTLQPMV